MPLKTIQLTLSENDLTLLSSACSIARMYYDTTTIPALQSGDVEQLYEFGYLPEEEEGEPGPEAFELALAHAKESAGEFADMEERLDKVIVEAWEPE